MACYAVISYLVYPAQNMLTGIADGVQPLFSMCAAKENMEKKLVQTMRQICREIGIHVKGQYLVKRAGVFEKVALREICYIYKEQKNSIFVTLQGKKANRESLKEVAGKLPKEQFVMAERGYIVNLLHVERLEKGMLTMDNGDLIKVGRGHNREIMQKMSEYMERGWR